MLQYNGIFSKPFCFIPHFVYVGNIQKDNASNSGPISILMRWKKFKSGFVFSTQKCLRNDYFFLANK